MPEMIVDFAAEPDGTFRGNSEVPAPVVFIRSHNHEGAPPRVSGPLGYTEPTDFGDVTRIEDLAQVRDGSLLMHAPGDGGFQTVTQYIGKMACPNLNMDAEFRVPVADITERKWVTFWMIPRPEWEAIGGLASTPGDPDFMGVVANRLPREPFDAIMWRHQGSPLGGLAWLVQGTHRRDGAPRKRTLPWEPIARHGTLHEHRVEIRGHNLRLLARPHQDAPWSVVFDTANDTRTRDIVPDSWIGEDIVVAVQAADYQSWDAGKGDGHGPATRELRRVRLRAPAVGSLVGAPPEEPPVEPEPPAEPEPPVEPEEPQPVGNVVTSDDLRRIADWIDAGRPATA